VIRANVVRTGTGRPVAFLSGLVGLNEHWGEVASLVGDCLDCHLLELPLLGLRGEDCSVGGATDLTIQYLETNHSEAPILVGNSFGGHVALRVALERPDLVRALVLAGSSGLLERTMMKDVQIRPSREWIARKIGELFCDQSKVSQSDLDRAYRVLNDRDNARAMIRLSRTARKNHLGDRISQIHCPVLLIWGREDVVTPPEAAEQFLDLIPDSRIVWFDRCGHAPMIERPEEFGAALLEFADELDQRERDQ